MYYTQLLRGFISKYPTLKKPGHADPGKFCAQTAHCVTMPSPVMKNNTLNKISLFLQGRPLILHYQVRQNKPGLPAYIEVTPSAELSEFNLKGLTPEMFCVNIADMVNLRRIFAGVVENEKQLAVARWSIDHQEYLEAIRRPPSLTQRQIADRLAAIPGFIPSEDQQYADFEACLSPKTAHPSTKSYGYRLTILTEQLNEQTQSRAYYYLDTRRDSVWLDKVPPCELQDTIRQAVRHKLTEISEAGINLQSIEDQTDYAIQDNSI